MRREKVGLRGSTLLYKATYISKLPKRQNRLVHSNSRMSRRNKSTRWYSLYLLRARYQTEGPVELADVVGNKSNWLQSLQRSKPPVKLKPKN